MHHDTPDYRICNTLQSSEAKMALLEQLRANPTAYLDHADTGVRVQARATYEAYKMDRPGSWRPESNAHLFLARLFRALRAVHT